MPFQRYIKPQYPPRMWLIEGEAGTGKSTFVSQLRTPMLPIDADHRFSEVADLVQGEILQLSSDPLDHIDVDRIALLISENIHGSGLKTIVVDSLTPIIAPLVTSAFRDNVAGRNRNRVSAYANKATAVRLLQDTLTGTGCDIAWVYHVYEGRDAQAVVQERTSITELELARILRSCNMRIRLSKARSIWTATVAWARNGRQGVSMPDETGQWAGMPELLEEAVYDNISEEEREIIEGPPAVFNSPVEAIRWGMDQVDAEQEGIFRDEAHAQNTYRLLREIRNIQTAQEMRDQWVAEVQARMEGGSTITEAERMAARQEELPPAQEEAPLVQEEQGLEEPSQEE